MSKLKIVKLNRFEKSYKKISQLTSFREDVFEKVLNDLVSLKKLDSRFKDHKLHGELKDYRECHISPDILLIYQIRKEELVLVLVNIGSHSDLFS